LFTASVNLKSLVFYNDRLTLNNDDFFALFHLYLDKPVDELADEHEQFLFGKYLDLWIENRDFTKLWCHHNNMSGQNFELVSTLS